MQKFFLIIFIFLLLIAMTGISSVEANTLVTCNIFLNDKDMPKLLKLVPKTDPILREIIPQEQNFKDGALEETIKDMCYSISPEQLKDSAAGMAANQWGIKRRVFIFTPDGSGSEQGKKSEIMINPSYVPYLRPNETEHKMVAAYEGCFSIPLTVGLIKRYDAIKVTYNTPTGEKIERVMEGYEARVFQHETDHLDGKLYDGKLDHYSGPECLERITFKDEAEMDAWIEQQRAQRQRAHPAAQAGGDA